MTADTQIKHKKSTSTNTCTKKRKQEQKKKSEKGKTSFIHKDSSNCRMHACFCSCSNDKLASRHSHRQNSTVLQT